MKTMRQLTRGSTLLGPMVLVVIPKCPLCLLPLLGAAGIAVSPQSFLDVTTLGVTAGWLLALLRFSQSGRARCLAFLATILVVAGWWVSVDAVRWAGLIFMIGISIQLLTRRPCCTFTPAGEPIEPSLL